MEMLGWFFAIAFLAILLFLLIKDAVVAGIEEADRRREAKRGIRK